MKKVYPVILTPDEIGYIVTVPDLNINTEGDSLPEAIEMARDAIGLWGICEEDQGRTIPEPHSVKLKHKDNEIVTLVDIDFKAYRRANENRSVRKNVTLPSWLNELAEQNDINFSAVLQEGLKQQLHINDRI